LLDEDQTTCVF